MQLSMLPGMSMQLAEVAEGRVPGVTGAVGGGVAVAAGRGNTQSQRPRVPKRLLKTLPTMEWSGKALPKAYPSLANMGVEAAAVVAVKQVRGCATPNHEKANVVKPGLVVSECFTD